ncbi:hypothetical protein GWI33_011404 [Rhynchophorus ferrugineus]|uniref:HAUS augmin-like complex subunit 6 N-terminal domain-containing protein n=1 Tax=Rhynchophorus ferrugineus TaxID=354439 RepID=A0A834IS70_RHYFE|nr:hypothetical protein GWI33_011404 [Rhynchophorus ferrugineus]
MDLFKQHRETEQKVHDNLYTNLVLLTHFYPPNKDFNAVFRKDMFVKNNKAAFFEVVHYMLNIISPELTKQKLTNWPIRDVKMEAKLRTEVISYVNELNVVYPYANIPTCQTSTLISPGGFRFAKFMLKISQLVLFKHLERSEEITLLFPLKHQKNALEMSKAQINHLNKVTSNINKESMDLLSTFQEYYEKIKGQGEAICESLTKLNKDIQAIQKQYTDIQNFFNTKYPSYPSANSLEEKFTVIKEQVQKVVEMNHLFAECEKLLKCISGTDLLLEHNEDDLDVPQDIQNIIQNNNQLDITQFFRGLTVLLEKKTLELVDPTKICIGQSIETINKLSGRYKDILKQLEAERDHINGLFDQLKTVFEDIVAETDHTLAVPIS